SAGSIRAWAPRLQRSLIVAPQRRRVLAGEEGEGGDAVARAVHQVQPVDEVRIEIVDVREEEARRLVAVVPIAAFAAERVGQKAGAVAHEIVDAAEHTGRSE